LVDAQPELITLSTRWCLVYFDSQKVYDC